MRPQERPQHLGCGTKMTSYCLKLTHSFFVLWLETAKTVHDDNWECVPATNAKQKVRQTEGVS